MATAIAMDGGAGLPDLVLTLAEKGDQEDKTGDKEKEAAEHRPEASNTGDNETDSGYDEQYPANEIDGVV